MNEDMYEDENGNWVLKSSFLRKRPHCCKSNCLHCPYGTTINSLGFEFEKLTEATINIANNLIDSNSGDQFTSSLLADAFGSKENKQKVMKDNLDQYLFVTLKKVLCGLVQIKNDEIKELYLKEHFKDQGIDKDNISLSFKKMLTDHQE